ncbi:MAG: YjgP/YjgQ family permease [Candidatus Omnitrophota bacterium]|jgi:lipopolysaccharide export system permease protein|nr:MAG: YjgP/YjgQ family permease [Candidatus Omnitrophota bacterium]
MRNPLKTVDFLLLKEFLSALLFIFSLFAVIGFVLVLFDDLDVILDHEASFSLGLAYVLLRLPHTVVKATPIVVILSMVISVGNMVRHNEILMLYIAGYKPLRLCIPLAILLSWFIVLLFFANEYICGPFAGRAQMLMITQIKKSGHGLSGQTGIWLYGEGDRIYRARAFFPESQKIGGLTIFEFKGPNRTLSARLDAESAEMNMRVGGWTLHQVVSRHIKEDGSVKREKFDEYPYFIEHSPEDFSRYTLNTEQMSHGELSQLVDTFRSAGENPRIYLPDLRIKEAFPFAAFFLGMLGFCIALRLGKSGHASGIGLGLLAAIGYFLALSLGRSLAQVGILSPWLSAWLPNVLCIIPTLHELYKIKEEI